MRYKKVLLVTDLREDSDIVASRAKCMLDSPDAKLRVLHVMEETVLTAGYEIVPIIPLNNNEDEIISGARAKMQELLARHNIIADDAHVETALSTRRGILDYCNKTKPDLIVIAMSVPASPHYWAPPPTTSCPASTATSSSSNSANPYEPTP